VKGVINRAGEIDKYCNYINCLLAGAEPLARPMSRTHITPAQANTGCARAFGSAMWRTARMSLT
jgi:hypothetical protein